MIKNITHKELVSILMQIHDELPSRFFQHWMRATINKLNSYEDAEYKAKKELGFYKSSFEAIQKNKKASAKWSRKTHGNSFIKKFLSFCKNESEKHIEIEKAVEYYKQLSEKLSHELKTTQKND
jgi:hypothetical protein